MWEVLHTVSRAQTVLHPPGFYAPEPLAAHCVQKNKTCWCTHDDHRKEMVLMCEHALCSELLFSVSFCRYAQEPGAAPSPPSLIHLVSEHDTHPGDSCTLRQRTVDNMGCHLTAYICILQLSSRSTELLPSTVMCPRSYSSPLQMASAASWTKLSMSSSVSIAIGSSREVSLSASKNNFIYSTNHHLPSKKCIVNILALIPLLIIIHIILFYNVYLPTTD